MSGDITTHASRLRDGIERDDADIIIIGSGASGATMARVLTEAGLDVIVLEEGRPVNREALRRDVWTAFRDLWRDTGFQAAKGRAFTPVIQGSCVGGTTVINAAIVHRIPEPILDKWHRQYGLKDALPKDELERIYSQIELELKIGPTPEDISGQNNLKMRDGLKNLGWSGQPINRNVSDCEGSARCLQGCPNNRKQAMHITYIPAAVHRGARVHSECRAEKILFDGDRATGIIARSSNRDNPRDRRTLTLHARRGVVIAASAIQSPLVLMGSGLGKKSRLVGRRFQAHPGTSVLGRFDDDILSYHGATQGYESLHYWDEKMKFESVGIPLEILMTRMPGVGRRWVKSFDTAKNLAQWGVQIRADTHGRVKKGFGGRASIHYDLVESDVRLFHIAIKRLITIMFAAGAREVSPGIHGLPEVFTSVDQIKLIDDLPPDPRLFTALASHLFGTALAGPDPATSVVDPWRRVHETKNVWVADSSVFPTNLGVNPQHTICAIAWHTAEHIADNAPRD